MAMQLGSVLALHIKPQPGALTPKSSIKIVENQGIEGDRCFGQGQRQVLFVSSENLNAFGYAPGDLREQITIDMPGLQALPIGTVIQVGTCRFRIEADCAPCASMARRLEEEPEAFKEKTKGKRGMFGFAMAGGIIHVGDPVRVLSE